jgi:hypothetical protein
VSRKSEAKNARRRRRRATRQAGWIPGPVFERLSGVAGDDDIELSPRNVTEVILGVGLTPEDGFAQDVVDLVVAAQDFEQRITARGWSFDDEFASDGFASWYYPPSIVDTEEPYEPVTRIFLTVAGSAHQDFPNRVAAVLAGTGPGDDGIHEFTAGQLVQHLDAIESYRAGDSVPAFG